MSRLDAATNEQTMVRGVQSGCMRDGTTGDWPGGHNCPFLAVNNIDLIRSADRNEHLRRCGIEYDSFGLGALHRYAAFVGAGSGAYDLNRPVRTGLVSFGSVGNVERLRSGIVGGVVGC